MSATQGFLEVITPQKRQVIETIEHNNVTDRIEYLSQKLRYARENPAILKFQQTDAIAPQLVVFDLDGTLTTEEFLLKVAQRIPQGRKLQELTTQALEGIEQWEDNYRERVKLLRGVHLSDLEPIIEEMKLSKGAKELATTLRNSQIPMAIVTGAFQEYAESIGMRLDIPLVIGTHWVSQNGVLTGEIKGEIISPDRKVEAINHLAHLYSIKPLEIASIGDGFNDLPMLAHSGTSYLFHSIQPVSPSLAMISEDFHR